MHLLCNYGIFIFKIYAWNCSTFQTFVIPSLHDRWYPKGKKICCQRQPFLQVLINQAWKFETQLAYKVCRRAAACWNKKCTCFALMKSGYCNLMHEFILHCIIKLANATQMECNEVWWEQKNITSKQSSNNFTDTMMVTHIFEVSPFSH